MLKIRQKAPKTEAAGEAVLSDAIETLVGDWMIGLCRALSLTVAFSPYLLLVGRIKRGSDKVSSCYLPSLRRASTLDASVIARAVLTRTKSSR